jgi:hypothetical protein
MLRHTLIASLSVLLASASLASARPYARSSALADTLPRAVHFGPPEVLTDSSVLGRWEINSDDSDVHSDSDARGRLVMHFYADHSMESHMWMMVPDSDGNAVYSGAWWAGTWFVRDTLLGTIVKECKGFTAENERECASWESEPDFGMDTGFSVVEPLEGHRYMHDSGMFAMLMFKYRGPDRDVTPPAYWTEGVPVRPRASGLRAPGPVPAGPVYDLLGRRPGGAQAFTPRFRVPRPGGNAGS